MYNFLLVSAASPFDNNNPENPDADKETKFCPPAQAMLTSCRFLMVNGKW
ncbi:MAG TPA: hypothetical protein PKN57_06480 [Saprospiraceae bacterium]|nr:hypothetical protein [Saprospiraceae bacterium]MCC6688835.1 hypothetical protein [Saprospiraceae bacterium]HMX83137.1 hypothetical protein [Saprospiraceae bacterium]HMZ74358.1 hypothetical protein [Saprospiraceae bacterium]HNA95227.1 hypothetical protein [Saprospiraceae bacterium]